MAEYIEREAALQFGFDACAVFEENEVKDGGKAKFPKHYTEGIE